MCGFASGPTLNRSFFSGDYMATGKLRFFNASKGFGFIVADDTGAEIYLPARVVDSARLPDLKPGAHLSYAPKTANGRAFADEISIVKPPITQKAAGGPPRESFDEFEREWGLKPCR